LEKALGVSDGQEVLKCCSPWRRKKLIPVLNVIAGWSW